MNQSHSRRCSDWRCEATAPPVTKPKNAAKLQSNILSNRQGLDFVRRSKYNLTMATNPSIGVPSEVLSSYPGANDTSNSSTTTMRSRYNLRPIRRASFSHFFDTRKQPQILPQQQAQPPPIRTRRVTVNVARQFVDIEQYRPYQQAQVPNITTRRVTVNLAKSIETEQHRPHHQQEQPPPIKTRRVTVNASRRIAIHQQPPPQQQAQPPPIRTRRVTINPTQFVEISHNKYSTKAYATVQATTKHKLSNQLECDVVVKRTKRSGEGLFADQIIPQKKFIGELVGHVITNDEQSHRLASGITSGRYSMNVNRSLVLDTEHMGNKIRKVNHSCRPNAVFKSIVVNGLPTILLYALKKINKDEEITVSYGRSYVSFGVTCGCGEEKCSGVVGL